MNDVSFYDKDGNKAEISSSTGTCISSSDYSGYDCMRAFDDQNNVHGHSYWHSGDTGVDNQWIGWAFNQATAVASYSLTSDTYYSPDTYLPDVYKFEARDTDSEDWETLDSYSFTMTAKGQTFMRTLPACN